MINPGCPDRIFYMIVEHRSIEDSTEDERQVNNWKVATVGEGVEKHKKEYFIFGP